MHVDIVWFWETELSVKTQMSGAMMFERSLTNKFETVYGFAVGLHFPIGNHFVLREGGDHGGGCLNV